MKTGTRAILYPIRGDIDLACGFVAETNLTGDYIPERGF